MSGHISSEEEKELILSNLYANADPNETGEVRTSGIVNAIKDESPELDPHYLKDLEHLLDPKRDDDYIKKEHFLEVGKIWIAKLQSSPKKLEKR